MNKPVKHICAVSIWLLWTAAVCSHDNWIAACEYFPGIDAEIQLHIGNGHNFPVSDSVISKRFVEGIRVLTPDGKEELLDVSEDSENKRLRSFFRINREGTYIVSYAVKRPGMEHPLAVGRTVVISGKDPGRYIRGEGLEISPLGKLSDLHAEDKLQVGLFLNGESIGGVLNITPRKGRPYNMRTTAERPAEISLAEEGKYMVLTSRGGQSSSFTFFVREKADEAD